MATPPVSAEAPCTEIDLKDVLTILDEQYDVTLEFCNAQTALLNAISPTLPPTADAPATKRHLLERLVDKYNTCLRRVQDHRDNLQEMKVLLQNNKSKFRRVVAVACKEHAERSQRVLATVQRAGGGVWSSPHGIALSANDSDTVTVALATLRASIDALRDVLKSYATER